MKFALLSILAVGGLMAANHTDHNQRLSGNERLALETSSPRVHVRHMKNNNETSDSRYRVVKDKQTINAFVPYGK
ncbi:MAG TPA: hypothetical protein VKU01_21975 [Bryobacteraceae bacterium]|nr:hypothetical protein [Bryobacteraceae bacterium]